MNRPLSIVLVTNNYIPYQGGVVSSIIATRQALEQQGHKVAIITLDFTGSHQPEPGVIRVSSPIRFMYKKNHMAVPLQSTATLATIFDHCKPDLVHVHHPFLLGQAAVQTAQQKNIPTLFTYHTLYEHYLHYVPLPKLITQPALESRLRSFCRSVDGIIAPGSFVEKQIRTHVPEQKIQIISSSIAPLFFNHEPPHKPLYEPYTLLTVSRFTPEKNIPFLLNVMNLLKRVPVRLMLAGYGSGYESLKVYAYKTLGLSTDQIIFIEKPAKQELLELYSKAHLFLFASQSDTQAIVLAEAMSQGTPVIALHGPGQEDIIINGYNGFLVESKETMVEKIESILSNEPLWQMLQSNALITAQNYTPRVFTEKLITFYSSVIKL
jgi:1,2-diacylglycerol 3-alpha-glucosyltransferase